MTSGGLHNFTVDSGDKTVQQVLNRLCLLSKLEAGEKIDITSMSLQQDTWFTRILRTLSGGEQSRARTLDFIKRTTDDALELAERCMMSTVNVHNSLGATILQKLDDAIVGIQKLNDTYASDRYFISALETQLLILKVKIDDLKKKFKSE
jgi:uncharacterized FAD-dependent dehydrogenase